MQIQDGAAKRAKETLYDTFWSDFNESLMEKSKQVQEKSFMSQNS